MIINQKSHYLGNEWSFDSVKGSLILNPPTSLGRLFSEDVALVPASFKKDYITVLNFRKRNRTQIS